MGGQFFDPFSVGYVAGSIAPFLRRLFTFVILAGALFSLEACQNQYSSNTYDPNGAQRAAHVDRAVVESIRIVDIRESGLGSGVGLLGGAAAGGIVGSQIGKGGGNALATLGGVLVGGAAGVLAEKSITDTQAYEYVLRKENGELVSVTQQDQQPFAVGQRVLVMYGAKARIVPDNTPLPPPAVAPQGQPASPTTSPAPSGKTVTPVQSAPSGPTVTPVQPVTPAPPAS